MSLSWAVVLPFLSDSSAQVWHPDKGNFLALDPLWHPKKNNSSINPAVGESEAKAAGCKGPSAWSVIHLARASRLLNLFHQNPPVHLDAAWCPSETQWVDLNTYTYHKCCLYGIRTLYVHLCVYLCVHVCSKAIAGGIYSKIYHSFD